MNKLDLEGTFLKLIKDIFEKSMANVIYTFMSLIISSKIKL